MNPIVFYSFCVMVCSGIFMLLYHLFVSRKAGYTFCRRYLIAAMILSVVIPALNVPLYHISAPLFNKDSRLSNILIAEDRITEPEVAPQMLPITDAQAQSQEPADQEQATEITTTVARTAESPAVPQANGSTRLHLPGFVIMRMILFFVYLAGVTVSLVMILRSIVYISRIRNRSVLTREQGYTLAENDEVKSPFSFNHTIFMGKEYGESERSQIMSHEMSHVRHNHSFEKLAMSLIRSVFWFNPFVWMAEKSLEEVQEWQADNDALSHGYDVDDYRDTVIRMLFGMSPLATTGMSTSFTKKRLLRMKEKESTGHALAVSILSVAVTLALFFCFGCKAVIEQRLTNDDDREIPGYPDFMKTEGLYREYLSKEDRLFFSVNDLIYAAKGNEPEKRTFFEEQLDVFGMTKRGLEILERPGMESLPTLICINGYKCADFPSSKELKWVDDKTIVIIGTEVGTVDEFRRLKPEDYLAIVYYRPESKRNGIPSLVYAITGKSLEYTTNYNYPAMINRPDADIPEVIEPSGFGIHGNYFICQDEYNIAITRNFAVDGRLVSLEEFKDYYKLRNWRYPLVLRNSQAERRFGKGITEVAELRSRQNVRVHFSNLNGLIMTVINGQEHPLSELKNLSKIIGISQEIRENDPLTYVQIFVDQENNKWITDEVVELIKQYIPWNDPALIINAFRKVSFEVKPSRESGYNRYIRSRLIPINPE